MQRRRLRGHIAHGGQCIVQRGAVAQTPGGLLQFWTVLQGCPGGGACAAMQPGPIHGRQYIRVHRAGQHQPQPRDEWQQYSQTTGSGSLGAGRSARSLLAFGAIQRSMSSNTVNTAGTMTSVSAVEVISPPITAIAIGPRKSLSPPQPIATGIMPATMATVVMTMGRARLCPDSMIAAMRVFPARISSMAKSTSKMEFF